MVPLKEIIKTLPRRHQEATQQPTSRICSADICFLLFLLFSSSYHPSSFFWSSFSSFLLFPTPFSYRWSPTLLNYWLLGHNGLKSIKSVSPSIFVATWITKTCFRFWKHFCPFWDSSQLFSGPLGLIYMLRPPFKWIFHLISPKIYIHVDFNILAVPFNLKRVKRELANSLEKRQKALDSFALLSVLLCYYWSELSPMAIPSSYF